MRFFSGAFCILCRRHSVRFFTARNAERWLIVLFNFTTRNAKNGMCGRGACQLGRRSVRTKRGLFALLSPTNYENWPAKNRTETNLFTTQSDCSHRAAW